MIEFLIALFLTLATNGNPCDMGQSIEWYDWMPAHPQAQIVLQYNPVGQDNIWLYQDGDELVMFVFKDDPQLVAASGGYTPHGKCAVRVDNNG